MMTVEDLIEKLKTLPPDAKIKTWNAYYDCEDYSVVVSKTKDGEVFILNMAFGEEV